MKTLLTIFALLFSVTVSAQDTTFNKRYYTDDIDGSDIGSTMIYPNMKNGVLVCGGNYNVKGLIMDIDSTGAINWNKTIQSNTSNTLTTDILTTSDTSIIVSGYNYRSSNDTTISVFCAKLDFSGDTSWTNTFDLHKPYDYWKDDYVGIAEISDTSYLLVASSSSDSIIKVIRMNDDGSIDWERNIEGDGYKVNAIHVNSDSTFLIAGSVNMEDGFIFKIDDSGTPIWSKTYVDQRMYDISSLHEEIYAISQDIQLSTIWLFKLDSSGNGIWSKSSSVRYDEYGDKILSSIPDLVSINDTLLAIVGADIEIKDTSGLSIENISLFPMRWSHVAVNDSGRVFISGNGPFYGIKATTLQRPHFGIIFTDVYLNEMECTWEKGPSSNDTLMINVDTLIAIVSNSNSLIQQSYTINSLPLVVDNECVEFLGSVEEQEKTQVKVYPNITTGKTNFELSKNGQYNVEIVDVNGNRVGEFEINGSYGSFDLSNEPAGIYFYKVFNENTNITGKIIKR